MPSNARQHSSSVTCTLCPMFRTVRGFQFVWLNFSRVFVSTREKRTQKDDNTLSHQRETDFPKLFAFVNGPYLVFFSSISSFTASQKTLKTCYFDVKKCIYAPCNSFMTAITRSCERNRRPFDVRAHLDFHVNPVFYMTLRFPRLMWKSRHVLTSEEWRMRIEGEEKKHKSCRELPHDKEPFYKFSLLSNHFCMFFTSRSLPVLNTTNRTLSIFFF